VSEMIIILTCTPDVPGSNMSRGTDGFNGYPRSVQINAAIVLQFRQ
jgi:hypothetical protein